MKVTTFKKGDRVAVTSGHYFNGQKGTYYCKVTPMICVMDCLGSDGIGHYIKLDNQSADFRKSQNTDLYWVKPDGIELLPGFKRGRIKTCQG